MLRLPRLRWTIAVALLAACSDEGKPRLSVEPSRLDLGTMTVGASYQGRLRLRNSGNAPLSIQTITASDPALSIHALQAIELPPEGSMEAIVRFDATEPGEIDASVTIVSGAGVTEVPITGVVERIEDTDAGQLDANAGDAGDAGFPDGSDLLPDTGETPDAAPCVPMFANPIPIAGTSTNGGSEQRPVIATDGAGSWVTLFESDDNLGGTIGADPDIFFSRSTDDGSTWSYARPIALPLAQRDGNEADEFSSLSYGGGAWVATWQSDITDQNRGGRIYAALSFDGAGTFSPPLELVLEQDDAIPVVATDGVNVIVAWHAHEILSTTAGTDGDINFVRSTDFGQNWSAIDVINDYANIDGSWDGDVRLEVLGPDAFIAIWSTHHSTANFGPDDDVLFSRSFDGGQTWEPARPILADPTEMTDEYGPAIAADRTGRIVVAWATADMTDTLMVATSSNGGESWNANPLPTIAPGDADPAVATDGAGVFLVAWHSHADILGNGTDGDILGLLSLDGGKTWAAPTLLNNNGAIDTGDDWDPHLASDGRQWMLVYPSDAPRELIYSARATCH